MKAKLGKLETYLSGLDEKRDVTLEAYQADRDIQDIVERRFEKAIQASLDIASHIVAGMATREPTSYRDIFAILAEEGVLEADVAAPMEEMAGFRNVLAHDYAEIDHERVHGHLDHLERFRAFARSVYTYVEERPDADTAGES